MEGCNGCVTSISIFHFNKTKTFAAVVVEFVCNDFCGNNFAIRSE